MVNFSGGEPFASGDNLTALVATAHGLGLRTRVTTGAAWSPDRERAALRLAPLARAGLDQLFISVSDPHQAGVPLAHALAATTAARELGVDVTLVAAIRRGGLTSARQLRHAFLDAGLTPPWILETPLIPFGRAAASLPPEEQLLRPVREIAGPCPSLTTNPMVHPDGTITGCASVFAAERPPLHYGQAPACSLEGALERMHADPLAAWIHGVGVVELKRLVENHSSIRFPEAAANICHLCGDILGRPEALAVIRQLFSNDFR
jgi:hypothetical protein